ncbi:MAG: hypothetical protein OXH63_12190 [Gemmatimonadetes bacterium]|nr:hypothetical protein [Gemmatimonadota bacterium]
MPLSAFQQSILRLLAQNRSPESYVAGATVLHQIPDSPRFSDDLDMFHDVEDCVARSAEFDVAVLDANGFAIEWILRQPAYLRAIAAKEGQSLRLEWAQDSAFRFFPVEQDELCGYRLHRADAATNKVLALAGRREARDFIDVLHLDSSYLSLGALCWAACGKDQGYTPDFLLDQLNRNAAFTQEEIQRLYLAVPQTLLDMKRQWCAAMERAGRLLTALPADEVGCLYLDRQQSVPVQPDPTHEAFPSLQRHFGSVRGAWPTIC